MPKEAPNTGETQEGPALRDRMLMPHPPRIGGTLRVLVRFQTHETNQPGDRSVLKFIGGTVGFIFLIGLLVVIGLFALIF